MGLFLAFGAVSYAQSQADAPADKQDAPKAQVVTSDQNKSGECAGHHAAGTKAECKWVDANNDGKCDTCGMTEAECKEKCATAPKKEGCAASCPMHKECGHSSGTTPSDSGKK